MKTQTPIKSSTDHAPVTLPFPEPEPTEPGDILAAARKAARSAATAARDAFCSIPFTPPEKRIQRLYSRTESACERVLQHLRAHELRCAQLALRNANTHSRDAVAELAAANS